MASRRAPPPSRWTLLDVLDVPDCWDDWLGLRSVAPLAVWIAMTCAIVFKMPFAAAAARSDANVTAMATANRSA